MATTDKTISNPIVNVLTKAQYDSIANPSEDEFYLITDDVTDVGSGGTGTTTLASGEVLIGNGADPVSTKPIDTTSGGTANSTNLITSGAVNSGLAGKADTGHHHQASDIDDYILHTFASPLSENENTHEITLNTVAVGKGGTGKTTFTSGEVLVGNGANALNTKPIDATAGGTSGSASLITSGAVYTGLAGKSDNGHHHNVSDIDDIANIFAANDAMVFKGTIGSSGATVTALPNTHSAGWTYRVITAGTYAGVACEIGDLIICVADGTAANNAHWAVAQANIDGAVIGPASATTNNIATFNATTGKLIKDSGYGITITLTDATKTNNVPTGAAVMSYVEGNFSGSGHNHDDAYVKKSIGTAVGDLVYWSASATPAKLGGNTTTTLKALTMKGTGSAGAAPAWSDMSALINSLTEGSSPAWRNDYIVAQYANGGTTTTTYHRRKLSNIFSALDSSDITNAIGYTPVNKAGDTMEGALTLSGAPTENLHAATKKYVDDNKYTHPTNDGNKHVPATGTTNGGKFLQAGSTAGSFSWEFISIGDISDFPSIPAAVSVKGNAESTYRTGQVNLTPANLGISATTTSVTVGSTTFNKYSHPTGDGNLHVPATGTSNNGKVLKAGSTAGSISWGTLSKSDVGLGNVANTTITVTSTSVSDGSNTFSKYTHPTGDGNLHVPATSTTNNGKFLKAGSTAGSISWASLTKSDVGLGNVANTTITVTSSSVSDGTNTFKKYTHPTGDGNLHVPATGTSNNGKVLKAGSTAGSLSWGTLSKSDVGLGNVANTTITVTSTSVSDGTNTFNKYTHPTTSGNKHIPSGGSSGQFLGWDSNGTAKWVNNPNVDTKVNVVARGTTKSYLMADTTSPTSTVGAHTAVAETGIYMTTTAGQLNAKTYKVNEAVTLQYDTTTKSLDFIFA